MEVREEWRGLWDKGRQMTSSVLLGNPAVSGRLMTLLTWADDHLMQNTCSPSLGWVNEFLSEGPPCYFQALRPITGEGNGSPLQCSCLENPRDGRAWWAAIYGVAQSRTRVKWLSSSSSSAPSPEHFSCAHWLTECRQSPVPLAQPLSAKCWTYLRIKKMKPKGEWEPLRCVGDTINVTSRNSKCI